MIRIHEHWCHVCRDTWKCACEDQICDQELMSNQEVICLSCWDEMMSEKEKE
jgi:hypothetical protein